MADYCTCGAQLPEDALFCHKCGKPQREILEPEVEANVYAAAAPEAALEATPAPPRQAPPQPLPLNFRNPIAVRIALLASIGSTILSLLQLQPLLSWLGAGFVAVYLYRWKTGVIVDVGSGVKIGWITGLISYVFYAILFAVPAVLSSEFRTEFLARAKNARLDPAAMQQLTDAIQSQPGMVLAFILVGLFVFVIGLNVVGGALGARIARNSK